MTFYNRMAVGFGALLVIFAPQAKAATLHDGTFDGGTYDAIYGPVQVEVTVQGGQVTDAQALQYPGHRRTSIAINNQALPALKREVVQAQSSRINIISGATLTSRAYIKSLADAIKAASN